MGYVAQLLRGLPQMRTHPSQDADWRRIWGAGEASWAGVDVTVEGSLALPAVWACVRVISETVGMLPLLTYRRTGNDGKERATNHALYGLLKEEPNGEQTAIEWREMVAAHVATWGNGYAEIEMNSQGRVRGLWPLLPQHMTVERKQGRLVYTYALPDGGTATLADWQVLHVRGLSGDGLMGYSPVRMAMQAIGLGLAAEEFGARFYGNGARPGIVLTHPGALSDKAKSNIRKSWEAQHGGLSQAHRVAVLEEGMKAEKLTIPPEEAQFLQTREFQAQDVARMYRMPPHKIGIMKNATFSNIEHQSIEFVMDTIMPWLVRFEQAYSRDLMSRSEQRSYFVEHLVDGLLRGDIQTRYQAYALGRQWGWLSINDIRRLENMDPVAQGDGYLQPLNMVEIGTEVSPTLAADRKGRGDPERALAGWVEEAAGRVAKREAADLRKALPKLRAMEKGAAAEWADAFYRKLAADGAEMLAPAVRAVAGESRDGARVALDAAAGYCLRHHGLLVGALERGEAPEEIVAAWEQAGAAELMEGVRRGATVLPA